MIEMPPPCAHMADYVMVIHVVLGALNSALVTFLSYRAVRRDRDERRRLNHSNDKR